MQNQNVDFNIKLIMFYTKQPLKFTPYMWTSP